MPDLSDAERAELERLRGLVGDASIPDRPRIEATFGPIDPMLAGTLEASFEAIDEAEWIAETKYDGTRVILEKFDGEVRIYTRRGIDRAPDLPSIAEAAAALRDGLILDGELTFLDPHGTSVFEPIHTSQDELHRRELAPTLFLFDVLYDGEDVTRRPLLERKAWLAARLESAPSGLVFTPYREADFPGFFREVTDAGEEGLILKRRGSQYYPGVRSDQWLKVKRFTERDAVVVGYTAGEGDRAETFGSLVLTDGERCIGRVGSGFTEAELHALLERFEPTDTRRVPESAAGAPYTPVEPFVIQVRYQELTRDAKLRAPVFVRLRPDKPVEDVQSIAE